MLTDHRSLFTGILAEANIRSTDAERVVYDADGVTLERFIPSIVLLPDTTRELIQIVRVCHSYDLPFVVRGAGTGLSGGALACGEAVLIVTTKLNRLLELNSSEQWAEVEPGMVNAHLSKIASRYGLHFAPDPSSGTASTIGGNIAENAGGPHCLKYGATAEHILELEVLLPDGSLMTVDTHNITAPLVSLFSGSEGTLGIVTKVKVKLTPLSESTATLLASFPLVRNASECVGAIIAAGIVPSALEMIDAEVIEALNEAFSLSLPTDSAALLLIEIDGRNASIERIVRQVEDICRRNSADRIERAANEKERMQLWQARKKAFGALGRVSPSYYTQDGVIARHHLPEALERIAEIGKKYQLRIANIFHAGDGNLHPAVLYDEHDPESIRRCLAAGDEILQLCIRYGGSITGEHGVGIEKKKALAWMFDETDITVMKRIRDIFNRDGRCNPGKFLPTDHPCAETGIKHRRVAV
jgi:glycolate oxidase